jgi:NitT/TauT family transport system ATP-binding protein
MSTAPHLFSTPLSTLQPAIDLRNVTKRFTTPNGSTYTAIRDMTLQVAPGEFCAIVGPTGCGKSTTLTLVSGLERPSVGSVSVHGEAVNGITPGVGFMFQTDAILPWKSVLDNVAMGPRFRGIDKANAIASAKDWIRRVGLAGFEDRFPHQLSGGMRKRVALAQSLINEPAILLMDEPFSALDVQTRAIMSNELLDLWDVTRPAVAGPGGTVKETFAIDLPRPRVVQEIRFDKRFVDLYQQIWEALRSEVDIAYSHTTEATRRTVD